MPRAASTPASVQCTHTPPLLTPAAAAAGPSSPPAAPPGGAPWSRAAQLPPRPRLQGAAGDHGSHRPADGGRLSPLWATPGPRKALAASAGANSRAGCPPVPTAEAGQVLSTVPVSPERGRHGTPAGTAPTHPCQRPGSLSTGPPRPGHWPPPPPGHLASGPIQDPQQRVQTGRHCPPPTLTPRSLVH